MTKAEINFNLNLLANERELILGWYDEFTQNVGSDADKAYPLVEFILDQILFKELEYKDMLNKLNLKGGVK